MLIKMEKQKMKEKRETDYYIFIDYSERLVGYLIIQKEKIKELLPRISKLHHYKDIKYKKAYIQSIKKVFEKNKIDDCLFKFKSKELKDNLSVFVDIIDFVKKYDNCMIFISVDNNQLIPFTKLLDMIPHKDHITIFKESDLNKGSIEYSLSLIIDTKLNIERIKITSK
jgi:hypothetical protein